MTTPAGIPVTSEWTASWEYVHPGDQIFTRGMVWIVTDRTEGRFMLRCPALKKTQVLIPRYDKRVTLIGPDHPKYIHDTKSKALTVVSETVETDIFDVTESYLLLQLEATPIARRYPTRGVVIPAIAMSSMALVRAHMLLVHDVWPDEVEDVNLREIHDHGHRDGTRPAVPHTHEET